MSIPWRWNRPHVHIQVFGGRRNAKRRIITQQKSQRKLAINAIKIKYRAINNWLKQHLLVYIEFSSLHYVILIIHERIWWLDYTSNLYIIAFPQESTKTGQTKLVTRQRSFLCTHRQFIIYIKLNPFSDWVWYITPTLSKLHAFSGRNSKQSNLINGTSVHKQFKTLRHYGCNKPPTNINCSYSCQWISPSAS